jgi:hypothetical protein
LRKKDADQFLESIEEEIGELTGAAKVEN